MTHPDPAIQQHQEQLLSAAKEGPERDRLAQSFRIGNTVFRYYTEAAANPTEDDFHHWLEGLPTHIRVIEKMRGYEANKRALALRRHAAERNDVGMEDYMRANFSPTDYQYWQQMTRHDQLD